MANSPTGESVLERADRILAAFTAEDSRLTGGRIAALTGLPTATAHRLARDMARQGWLERVEGGHYVVGTRLWELASRSSRELGLARAARPFMGDIHAVLRQHVQLGIVEGREVLLVERLSHPRAVPVRSAVAGRLPLHLSATGLVLLAHALSRPHRCCPTCLRRGPQWCQCAAGSGRSSRPRATRRLRRRWRWR